MVYYEQKYVLSYNYANKYITQCFDHGNALKSVVSRLREVQCRATKATGNLGHLLHEEMFRDLELYSLEKQILRGKISVVWESNGWGQAIFSDAK